MRRDAGPRVPGLPPSPRGLVGRQQDVERLHGWFRRSTAPLMTLTGPGGVGKTALALCFANALAQSSAEVAFCHLADARDDHDVAARLAGALGVPALPKRRGDDAFVGLGRILGPRGSILVILDNAEHVAEAAAHAVGRLMESAPEARILVTSRERLRLAGELVHELNPLSLPGAQDPAGPSDAALLFAARARELVPTFDADRDAAAIGRLVTALDGLPLAIELAAQRVRVAGPAELLARFEQRLDALGRGPRGAPERQGTLRAAIDWSWELLDPDERRLLLDGSVFRGSFDLDAAEHVLGASDSPSARTVLEVLGALCDKSLVRSSDAGQGVRFRLLSTVRGFAEEKLVELGRADAARERHAEYFVVRAETQASSTDGAALVGLSALLDNALAVVDRALDAPEPSPLAVTRALRTLAALDGLAGTYGYLGAHVRRVGRALEVARGHAVDEVLVARLLVSRGRCAVLTGGVDTRDADLRRATDIARRHGDLVLEGRAAVARSRLDADAGRDDAGARAAEAALALAARAGDRALEGAAALALGLALHRTNPREAVRHCLRAREVQADLGDWAGVAEALAAAALAKVRCGEIADARRTAEQALEVCRGEARLHAEGLALEVLGACAHVEQRLDAAISHYEAALRVAQATGDRRVEATANAYLGLTLFDLGRTSAARWQIADARSQLREVGMSGIACLFDAVEGTLAADSGEADVAEGLLDRAEREASGIRDVGIVTAVDLCRALVEVTLAEHARRAGAPARAEALVDSARRRLELAQTACEGGPPPVARSLEGLRLAALVSRRLRGASPVPDRALRLDVGEDGAWFCVGSGAVIGLEQRALMARLLLALARARVERPGSTVPAETLVEAGWAGERMLEDSKKNRLKVALARLRDLGLRGVILSAPGGYLVSPDVEVTLGRERPP